MEIEEEGGRNMNGDALRYIIIILYEEKMPDIQPRLSENLL